MIEPTHLFQFLSHFLHSPLGEFQYVHTIWEIGRTTPFLLHDIANPLATASVALETILQDAEPGLQYQAKAIDKLTTSLTCLKQVEALLKQQQLRQKSSWYTASSFLLCQEIETLHQIYQAHFRKQHIQVQVKIPGTLRFLGSRLAFQRVLSNLLLNAAETYATSHAKKKLIIISLVKQPFVWQLEVRDFGPGIPAKNLSMIFDVFFTTKQHGTGLGLAIVKQLVEQELKGKVTVKSVENEGTVFQLTLPEKCIT